MTTKILRRAVSFALLTLLPSIAGAGDRPHRANDDEILDHRGQVRLTLTGFCGPDGRGRRAILQSYHRHETVRATVETSQWAGDRFRSNSFRSYSLRPLEEKQLGCTVVSANSERRFALTEVSDASSYHPKLARGPARDAVDLVASGTCGRGRQSRTMTLVNRHPERRISVRVVTRIRVGDRQRRQTSTVHLLAPGAQKHLGCSADGPLVHLFDLAEVKYR